MKLDCFGLFFGTGGAARRSLTMPSRGKQIGRGFRALIYAGLAFLWSPVDATAQMTVSGEFSVSATGAAVYAIPLAIPPGTADMTPSLSLIYSSQSGNGPLGMGWSLGGMQSIARCPQTVAQDNFHGSVNHDGNDRFCLGGQRLVVVNGTYGADGAEYRTEIDSFSRILSHGTSGAGPAWFEIRTKSGQLMEFGRTSDSFIETASGSATARLWALDKISDTKGNSYTISYTSSPGQGEAFPSRIDYTSNTTTGLAPYASVRFSYEGRTDIRPLYMAGSLIETTKRLKGVRAYVGSTLAVAYQLAYQQGSVTGRSRLASLKQCSGNESICLPATTFDWADGDGRSDLLNKITSGLTATTAVTYAPLTDASIYVKDTSAKYPLRDWRGPMFVVSKVDVSNGIGGVNSTAYSYSGARIDLTGRGFLPFRQTVVKDLKTNIVQTTNYRQNYPYIGLVASETKVLGSQTLTETLSEYQFSNANGQASVSTPSGASAPYSVSIKQSVTSSFDLDGSTLQAVRTTFKFDPLGNPTQVSASTWDGFIKTTNSTYTNDTTKWLLGRLETAVVSTQAPGAGASPPPAPIADLAVTKTHQGALAQGQTGVPYTIVVKNVGLWPTKGAVSVIDTLPTGLSATAIAGDGWSCVRNTLTCTRSDPLGGGASYPSIRVTVDVASNAPSSITNVATVSGGDDASPANNTASDVATVTRKVTIASNVNNLDLWSYLVSNGYARAGQAETWVVTVNSGVVIGSTSTGDYAFDTGVFPSGSSLQIVNNGTITGAGGKGGAGGYCRGPAPTPAGGGGPALNVRTAVTITNNGAIWGGGGGGGGGVPTQNLGISGGGGGGGGAGSAPGAGGAASGVLNSAAGSPGALSSGGAGGGGTNGKAGKPGAGPGLPGASWGGEAGLCGGGGVGGAGGAAGASVVGNSLVTWAETGDIRGPTPAAPLTDLSIVAWHSADFIQGQTAATYTLSVSNVGAWASSGAVTVTDALPGSLTARSMSGSGWSCTLATRNCTRSDPLAGGASYPAITLSVDVAANAPASVTNVATVSGGGDANSANNAFGDPTSITPATVPPTNVTISTNAQNLNLWTYLVNNGYATAGQAGTWFVTINSKVVIGSNSTGAYAFDTGVFPSGSTLQIINNGIITGAGGNGGVGGANCSDPPANGANGGPALRVQTRTTIANNGSIWGGGGGGGGGGSQGGVSPGGAGGGGGAGSVAGSGASGAGSPPTGYSGEGLAGTLTAGGAGGYPGYTLHSGGDPGKEGLSLGTYLARCGFYDGAGGAAGAAVVGNSLVTWGTAGDVRGPLN